MLHHYNVLKCLVVLYQFTDWCDLKVVKNFHVRLWIGCNLIPVNHFVFKVTWQIDNDYDICNLETKCHYQSIL